MRADSLLESGKIVEAYHYLNNILLEIVENYVWLKSSIDRVRIDYTTLMRSFESFEEKNPRNYEAVIKFLDLGDIDGGVATRTIEKAREMILRIRSERKVLIKNLVKAHGF